MYRYFLLTSFLITFLTSAYISVFALYCMFSGAGIVIILLSIGFETGKVLTIFHLHRKWQILRWFQRGFYIFVVVALLTLTASEVLGFLSMSHVTETSDISKKNVSLSALEEEEALIRDRLKIIDGNLSNLPPTFVTKRISERISAGYSELQERLTEIVRNKSVLQKAKLSDTSYSAPIYATARLFGIDEAKVASSFICFLTIIAEFLSIGLAVAVSITWLPSYPVSQENTRTGSTHKQIQKEDYLKTQVTQDDGEHSLVNESTDPVVASIMHLVDSAGKWSGTMTELLAVLNNTDQHGFVGKNGWPDDPHGLGKRIKRLEQKLSEQGIYVTRSRTQESRKVELGRIESIGNV